MKHTPLYQEHMAMGGQMANYKGYALPNRYRKSSVFPAGNTRPNSKSVFLQADAAYHFKAIHTGHHDIGYQYVRFLFEKLS